MPKRPNKPTPAVAELPAERRVRNLRAQIQATQLEMVKASLPKSRTEMAMASHRGAVAARMGQSWGRSQSWLGGTTRDRWELGSMRDRGRRVYRENALGRSFLKVEADNVIADGFTLQMRSSSPEFNREAEDRFYPWLDRADVAQRFTASDWFRWTWIGPRKDGDGGVALVKDAGYPRLQCIPGDLVRNPYAGFDPRTMYDGVECDLAGAPVRFHVRTLVEGTGTDRVDPVDARDFVYINHTDEPLDVRGTTVYAPIFGWLDDTDSYIDAVVKAARMAAIFGLIERTDKPGSAVSPLLQQPNAKGDLQGAVTLENGMLKIHGSAGTVYQVQAQQPMQQTPDFIRAMTRLLCLCFDMPLEIGMRDLSQVNFSGGRIGLTGFYRSCRVKQDWIKSKCWNRIVYWWLSVERQRQRLGYADAFRAPFPADYGAFDLSGREWNYNDPLTEAQADLLEISMGIKSEQQACAERGRDWEGTQRQIADARKLKTELGIPIVLSNVTRDQGKPAAALDASGNPIGGDARPAPGNDGAPATGKKKAAAKVAVRRRKSK